MGNVLLSCRYRILCYVGKYQPLIHDTLSPPPRMFYDGPQVLKAGLPVESLPHLLTVGHPRAEEPDVGFRAEAFRGALADLGDWFGTEAHRMAVRRRSGKFPLRRDAERLALPYS